MKTLHDLENAIKIVPNFPKEGISFKDITPLFRDHFSDLIDELAKKLQGHEIDYFIGIESRGFILAAGLAEKLKKGFIPIRKKGKLPPPVIAQSYQLEYGQDTLEINSDLPKNKKVAIIDDVIATGGTLEAAYHLCKNANLIPVAAGAVITLDFLYKKKLPLPIVELFKY
jgi:adenine phosphoribosyltransferase